MFFHKAFGQSLIPGFDSMTIPLYIGDPIRIEGSYEDEQVRQEEYKRRLQRIPGINRKIHTFRDTKGPFQNPEIKKKVSEKDAFFFCYAARLLSIFIFKTSLVFSIISFGKVILQK